MIQDAIKIAVNYTLRSIEDNDLCEALYVYFSMVCPSIRLSKNTIKEFLHLGVFTEQSILGVINMFADLGKTSHYHNLVPNVLRYELATLIAGTTVTPTFKANKIAVGDDGTAVSIIDTSLGNETIREDFTARSAVDNVAYLDKFFSSLTVGGQTFLEAGIFVDGAAAVNGAGYLLSHVNINETLTSTESLTFNCTFTISNV